jgi:hypothetical protein
MIDAALVTGSARRHTGRSASAGGAGRQGKPMTWIVRLLVAGCLALAWLAVTALPSQAASCRVWRSGSSWSASCSTGSPGTTFQMQVRCSVSVHIPYTYTAYGNWARQGSGASTAGCNAGHYPVWYGLAFR